MDIKLMPEKYKEKKELSAGLKLSLSKLGSKTNFWLILTVSFLVLVILICFGLWGYKNSLIREKENLEGEFEELTSQRDLELETNLIALKEGIDDFKKILEQRLYSSKFFKMLDELTLPRVQFTGLNADLSQAVIVLKTEVINYQTLAKQIVAFEQDWRIKKVELSEVRLNTAGRLDSDLGIELNPDFLHEVNH